MSPFGFSPRDRDASRSGDSTRQSAEPPTGLSGRLTVVTIRPAKSYAGTPASPNGATTYRGARGLPSRPTITPSLRTRAGRVGTGPKTCGSVESVDGVDPPVPEQRLPHADPAGTVAEEHGDRAASRMVDPARVGPEVRRLAESRLVGRLTRGGDRSACERDEDERRQQPDEPAGQEGEDEDRRPRPDEEGDLEGRSATSCAAGRRGP